MSGGFISGNASEKTDSNLIYFMQPLVSVIIPLYNAENFIVDTIDSVLKQTHKNIEIIVVDDGSKDLSVKRVRELNLSSIIVVQQTNKGASAARNHGLKLAKGEFIQYLDADDILHPEKIERQIDLLKNYSNFELVGCKWRYFKENINKSFKTMPFNFSETTHFDKIDWLKDRPYMIPHTWLVSKELIQLAGPWNENLTLNDDGEYFYRVIAASNGVAMVGGLAMAYYRAGNPNSLSTSRTKASMLSWLESIKSYKMVMFSIAGNKANEAVDRAFFEVNYHCLNVFPDLAKAAKLEMYDSSVIFDLFDSSFYLNLSKRFGVDKAKKVRELLTYIRNTKLVNYIFFHIKRLIGRENH